MQQQRPSFNNNICSSSNKSSSFSNSYINKTNKINRPSSQLGPILRSKWLTIYSKISWASCSCTASSISILKPSNSKLAQLQMAWCSTPSNNKTCYTSNSRHSSTPMALVSQRHHNKLCSRWLPHRLAWLLPNKLNRCPKHSNRHNNSNNSLLNCRSSAV